MTETSILPLLDGTNEDAQGETAENQGEDTPDLKTPLVRPVHHHTRTTQSNKPSDNVPSLPFAVLSRESLEKQFEHRHYFALYPNCNKLLAKRWEDHTKNLHYRRLQHAKPSIDNSQPRVYPHLEFRQKRIQLQEGWYILLLYLKYVNLVFK
jgi:hypothetical protein